MKIYILFILLILMASCTRFQAPTDSAPPDNWDFAGKTWFNVRDLGAVGDSLTDDYDALQLVLDSLGELGGGTCYIPTGTYRITSTLMYDSNLHILGSGQSKIYLEQIADYDADGATLLSRSFDTTTAGDFFTTKNVLIENLTIEGTTPVRANGIGIVRADNVTVRNCRTYQLSHHLVDIVGSSNVTVEDCYAYNTGGGALQVDNATSGWAIGRLYGTDSAAYCPLSPDSNFSRNVIVRNNHLVRSPIGVHFHRTGGKNILIQGNTFDSCGTINFGAISGDQDIAFRGWSNISIVDNIINNIGIDSRNIWLYRDYSVETQLDSVLCNGLNITGNIIKGGRLGISVNASKSVNISNNIVDSLADPSKASCRGIALSHIDGVVSNNVIKNIGYNHSGDGWTIDTSFGSRTEAIGMNLSRDSGLVVSGNFFENIYGAALGFSIGGGWSVVSNNWIQNSGVGIRILIASGYNPHHLNIINNSITAGTFSWYGIYDSTTTTTNSYSGNRYYGTFGTKQDN